MLNRFRHPAPAVEHRWTAAGVRFWRSDRDGAVVAESLPAELRVRGERQRNGRYWQDAEAGATCRAMSGATCWATWGDVWGEGEASAGKRRSKARARPRAQLAVSISSTGTCAKLAGFICLCFKHYSDNVSTNRIAGPAQGGFSCGASRRPA